MAQVINTNVASLNAQRNLNTSQSALATSLQRLSSGLRINSAKDDTAGLAISERMTAQIRGMNQAARNANDGVSLAQTAEGDLVQITNNLQRIRELAVQSANATNSTTDRTTMQAEVAQLVAETDRIAANSSFNGVSLLDGTFNGQVFQVGANASANDRITITSINSARTSALGASYSASVTSAVTTSTPLIAGALSINGISVGAPAAGTGAGQANTSAWAVAQAINAASTGVSATANSNTVTGAAPAAAGAITASTFTINGINVGAVTAGTDVVTQGANVAAAITLISGATGVTATASGTTGAVTLTASDGRNIVIGGTITNTGLTAATTYGTVTLASTSTAGITIAGTAPGTGGFTAATTAATQGGTAVSALSIATSAGAGTALASIDAALNSINSIRGTLGAYQNRFEATVASLQTSSENLSASRSRIQDTDFAAEVAALTRNQILQQAGTAMLAQANSLPQNVLSLLK